MSERIAFRMNLNPGQAAAYKQRHDDIFPELAKALKDAGVSHYTIWLDPETNHLFATLVRTADHTMDHLPNTAIVKRWWAFMADVMETDASNVPTQIELIKMFDLK
ncbi:MAG: L-rhamnose mutarotase [Devosia sp.]